MGGRVHLGQTYESAARCALGQMCMLPETLRGALAGDAYVQTQDILGTIRSALEQAGARVEDVVRQHFSFSLTIVTKGRFRCPRPVCWSRPEGWRSGERQRREQVVP